MGEGGEILYCCEQTTITVTAKEASSFQLPHNGTPAWRKACGYRNPAESAIGMIRGEGRLIHGWCRALGTDPQYVGGIMLIVAHNMSLQEKEADARTTKNGHPKNPKPNPPKTPPSPKPPGANT